MSILFKELEYAAYLIATNTKAKKDKTFNGRISAEAEKQVKEFLLLSKSLIQKLFTERLGRQIYYDQINKINKNKPEELQVKKLTTYINRKLSTVPAKKLFYIKSFFFNLKAKQLVLFCRKNGTDYQLNVKYGADNQFYFAHGNVLVVNEITRILSGILSYNIPSETSLTGNIKAISLMPSWREDINSIW